MNVLIAVDETAESLHAVTVARHLFGDDASYTVVSIGAPSRHVVALDPIGGTTYDVDTIAAPDPAEPVRVAEHAANVGGLAAADIAGEIGQPGPQLCQLALDRSADVIVVGSHERGFLSRLLDPPVQTYLLHHAPCPVLVARRHLRTTDERA